MSKEELENAVLEAWDYFKMGRHLLPPKEWFFCGYRSGAKWQASHTPAVSVEGERAAEEYALAQDCYQKADLRAAYLAGFQARSHLVELLIACRLAIEALKTTQKETGLGPIGEMIGEDLLARIDAALKGEK